MLLSAPSVIAMGARRPWRLGMCGGGFAAGVCAALGAAMLVLPYAVNPQRAASESELASRFSKLSLISAPFDLATQRMDKALEGERQPQRADSVV